MPDLNEIPNNARVNRLDALWYRAHLAQFEGVEYWDHAAILSTQPRRNRLLVATLGALYSPGGLFDGRATGAGQTTPRTSTRSSATAEATQASA